MDEYQKAKEEDLYQLLPMMMELKENQERMAQIIAEHGTQVTQLLGLMQMVRPPSPFPFAGFHVIPVLVATRNLEQRLDGVSQHTTKSLQCPRKIWGASSRNCAQSR